MFAGKLGIPPSPGMAQGKDSLISQDKHHPHFPLHMYAHPGSLLTSPKPHRDEPSLSSSKDDDFVTCPSELLHFMKIWLKVLFYV